MGLLSRITKGILSGIRKIFKKIVTPKVIKIVIAAALIYVGGAALGMWGGAATTATTSGSTIAASDLTISSSIEATTSTLAPAAAEVGSLSGLGTGTGGAVSAGQTGSALTAGFETGVSESMMSQAAASTAGGAVPSTLGSTGLSGAGLTQAAPPVESSLGGEIWQGVKDFGSMLNKNPALMQVGLSALGSAMSPDEEDLAKIRKDEFEYALKSRRENLTGYDTLPRVQRGSEYRRTGRLVRP